MQCSRSSSVPASRAPQVSAVVPREPATQMAEPFVGPSPATHAFLTALEAGGSVFQTLLLEKPVCHAYRGAQPLFHALSGVKTLSETLFPAFNEKRVTGLQSRKVRDVTEHRTPCIPRPAAHSIHPELWKHTSKSPRYSLKHPSKSPNDSLKHPSKSPTHSSKHPSKSPTHASRTASSRSSGGSAAARWGRPAAARASAAPGRRTCAGRGPEGGRKDGTSQSAWSWCTGSL